MRHDALENVGSRELQDALMVLDRIGGIAVEDTEVEAGGQLDVLDDIEADTTTQHHIETLVVLIILETVRSVVILVNLTPGTQAVGRDESCENIQVNGVSKRDEHFAADRNVNIGLDDRVVLDIKEIIGTKNAEVHTGGYTQQTAQAGIVLIGNTERAAGGGFGLICAVNLGGEGTGTVEDTDTALGESARTHQGQCNDCHQGKNTFFHNQFIGLIVNSLKDRKKTYLYGSKMQKT